MIPLIVDGTIWMSTRIIIAVAQNILNINMLKIHKFSLIQIKIAH